MAYLLKMVIFHGELLNNQMVPIEIGETTNGGMTINHSQP